MWILRRIALIWLVWLVWAVVLARAFLDSAFRGVNGFAASAAAYGMLVLLVAPVSVVLTACWTPVLPFQPPPRTGNGSDLLARMARFSAPGVAVVLVLAYLSARWVSAPLRGSPASNMSLLSTAAQFSVLWLIAFAPPVICMAAAEWKLEGSPRWPGEGSAE